MLADEGIEPEFVTLTSEQYHQLLAELDRRREYWQRAYGPGLASVSKGEGMRRVSIHTTRGAVDIRCGR